MFAPLSKTQKLQYCATLCMIPVLFRHQRGGLKLHINSSSVISMPFLTGSSQPCANGCNRGPRSFLEPGQNIILSANNRLSFWVSAHQCFTVLTDICLVLLCRSFGSRRGARACAQGHWSLGPRLNRCEQMIRQSRIENYLKSDVARFGEIWLRSIGDWMIGGLGPIAVWMQCTYVAWSVNQWFIILLGTCEPMIVVILLVIWMMLLFFYCIEFFGNCYI